MADGGASETTPTLGLRAARELSDSPSKRRSVRYGAGKQWQPPEGLAPEDVLAVIDAAATERDRLLLRVLWATGARISEALAVRPMDVRRDSLVLPNLKNPSRTFKRVFLPAGQMDLPGALLLWAREHELLNDEPIFFLESGRPAARDGRLADSKRGRSSALPRNWPTCGSWRFEHHSTVWQASQHPSIRTCSATRACGRSCA